MPQRRSKNSGTTVGQPTGAEQQGARAELVKELDQAKEEVAKASQRLTSAADEDERTDAKQDLDEAQADQRGAEAMLSVFDKAAATASDPGATATVTGEELKALSRLNIEGIDVKADGVVKKLARNPDLMFYKFKNTAYKFSFLLIPISLPFLWLMFFWKRDVTTYDHMVFSMYSLSFMSLLFVMIVLLALSTLTSRVIPYLLWLPPLHMFLQLKETYRLKFFSALWRTLALLISAGTVFVLFIVLVGAIVAM